MVVSVAGDGSSDGSTGGANTGRSSFNTGGNEFERIRKKSVGGLVVGATVVAVNLSVALHNKIKSNREIGWGAGLADRHQRNGAGEGDRESAYEKEGHDGGGGVGRREKRCGGAGGGCGAGVVLGEFDQIGRAHV